MNELVHRANFRFSDLHTWLQVSRQELNKCHELKQMIQDEIERLMAEAPEDE